MDGWRGWAHTVEGSKVKRIRRLPRRERHRGSAGGGSQKAAEAEGEEGTIAHGTHLATGNMHVHDSDVGTVRRKAAKKDKKENVCIADMARRVRNRGIAKPQNAQHSAWTWEFTLIMAKC